MQSTANRHACAVCPASIGHDFLMCGKHWRLVPPAQQLAVYRTWGALQRMAPTGRPATLQVRQDYLRAKDAAVASVRAALATATDQQPTEGQA